MKYLIFTVSRIGANICFKNSNQKLHQLAVYKKRAAEKAYSPFSIFSCSKIDMTYIITIFLKKYHFLDKSSEY